MISQSKKITVFLLIFFLNKFCFSQQSFKDCYDSFIVHWTHDTGSTEKAFIGWQNCLKGKLFPSFSLQTISGERIETEKLRGKIVVINLWFTSCEPCMEELPALNRLVQEYKNKNIVLLGITFDSKAVLDQYFFPKYKFDFKIIPNSMDIIKRIGNTGFPTTFIIDSKGKVKDVWNVGLIGDLKIAAYERAKPIIDELLNAK
jgi:peroxiredoxin